MVRVGHSGEPDGAEVGLPYVWQCGTPLGYARGLARWLFPS